MSVFFRQFQHLLPRAKAWTLTPEKTLRAYFEGLGNGLSQPLKTFVDGVWEQVFPATTDELDEWEQELGCYGSGSDAQRRLSLAAEWQATGGQSPRYLEDIVQAAGFEVWYHGWWSGAAVRDPTSYTDSAQIGTEQCWGTQDSTQDQCADSDSDSPPRCDAFLVNDVKYMVNLHLNMEAPPPLPTDTDRYRYFIYWCGETFGDDAVVPNERLLELRRLLLRICPAHLWIILLTVPVFSAPEFGSQLLVGVTTSVEGNRPDSETVVLTWGTGGGSAGTVTYPTSTTWACDVTPTLSDLAETGLTATIGGDMVSTLRCSVSDDFEDYFDEDVLIAFEVGRGTTQSGGTISEQAPSYDGTDADVLATTVEPNYNATDSDFGNRPSAQGTGTQWLKSTTPADAVEHDQPLTRVLLCRVTATAASYVLDSANSNRCGILPQAGGWSVNAAATQTSTIAVDTTQGCLVCAEFGGSGAWALRVRKADGTLSTDSGSGAGSNSMQGTTWLANYQLGTPVQAKIAAHADIVGSLSAGTLTKLEGYLTGVLGWSALP
jgi:hypothetical protein